MSNYRNIHKRLAHTDKYLVMFMSLYLFLYTGDALYGSYIPLYLDKLGLDSASIGALLAITPMISVVAQPLWGVACDRAQSKNRILAVMILGATASFFLMPYVGSLLPALFFLTMLYNAFRSSTHGVVDAISLEYLDTVKGKYGPLRMCGTIGYALMSVIGGYAASARLENIFWLFAVPALAAMILLFFLPTVEGHMKKGEKVSIYPILHNKELLILLLIGLVFQSTAGYYQSFYSLYFRNDLGGSPALLGLIISFSAIAEIPFLLFSDRLMSKFGITNLLLTACFVGSLRWILTSVVQNPQLQFYVQLLHGMNNIVFIYCMAVYINQNMPAELKASGQTFYSFFIAVGSRVIGSWLGGALSNYISKGTIFMINGLVLLAALFALLIWTSLKRYHAANRNDNMRLKS